MLNACRGLAGASRFRDGLLRCIEGWEHVQVKPYRTNLRDVPHVGGLSRDEGWINMQVQFLIDQKTAAPTNCLSAGPCCARARATTSIGIRTWTNFLW